MKSIPTLVLYLAIGVNLGATLYHALMWKRRAKAYEQAMRETISEFMPAIAFCVAMRNSPSVPDVIRNMAATAIPKSVEIEMTPMADTGGKVH